MPKYIVQVESTITECFTVEADSPEQAMEDYPTRGEFRDNSTKYHQQTPIKAEVIP